MPPTPEEQSVTMISNLEKNTGATLSSWLDRARAADTDKHGQIVKYLKTDHGLTHGFANLVAHKLKEQAAGGPAACDDLVANQYTGKKSALRPIYDALAKAVKSFGGDVEFAPKKAYVSVRRKKQFGLIQPSTATRVDVGINLKGREPTGRLESSGSFNAMVSHRVRLAAVGDVDAELVGWLRDAYDSAG
ncbi:MAG: DUF4287 domain-containing protein [Opitutaceae bacterium]|nr:DUF4287 domain-containing protein [Opitutaceae bacterium]